LRPIVEARPSVHFIASEKLTGTFISYSVLQSRFLTTWRSVHD
jgi:hypothetical protein